MKFVLVFYSVLIIFYLSLLSFFDVDKDSFDE